MPASIGVNLRVTGHCSQGGRKYMEDLFSVAYQQTEDERDLEYAFFGIYDGHGGSEAATYAKEHLMDSIVKQRQFWSDDDEDVLKAIRNGYMLTHLNMWKELDKWPKTVTGLPSTAGTTASVAFIRRGKIYVGHVGDSAIVLGYQKEGSDTWAAKPLTSDHKPESPTEMERIQRCGGKVVSKAGVPRVVWNRPRPGHKGPIKKSTPMDEIPFLAVARSLGDLWSYNPHNDDFIVSPDPDVGVLTIDPSRFRCLIFGTDGLWNMMTPEVAVSLVQTIERQNEATLVGAVQGQPRDWLNPSKSLVDHALERWSNTRMRADNTSVVTLMLDPPGPPRATVLRSRIASSRGAVPTPPAAQPAPIPAPDESEHRVPQNGLTILTRYVEERADRDVASTSPVPATPAPSSPADRDQAAPDRDTAGYGDPSESYFMSRLLDRSRTVNTLLELTRELLTDPPDLTDLVHPPPDCPELVDTEPLSPSGEVSPAPADVQINEVSSSSPVETPPRARTRRGKTAAPPDTRVLRSRESRRQTVKTLPAPADRVVILSRARGSLATPLATRADSAPERPREPSAEPARPRPPVGRTARSRESQCAPVATRSSAAAAAAATPGNSARAPGPALRSGPVARGDSARERSKENCGANRRRRPAARPPPAPLRPRPRPADEPEVHSTTVEPAERRALRSRNSGEASAPPGRKRAPDEEREHTPAGGKTARLGAGRQLTKRGSAPWAPALALRNRLRKRLAK